jgi:NAD-dependent deacetylase
MMILSGKQRDDNRLFLANDTEKGHNADMKTVILTGAGISAESGVPTFRASDGLWEGHRVEDVATPDAFFRNPALVREFYNMRRAHLHEVEPNPAHRALAALEKKLGESLTLVTQNVDDLHERGGSQRVIHMHGSLLRAWCLKCDERFLWRGAMNTASKCPFCRETGDVRPDIVWFGEMPYQMDVIEKALVDCEVFVSIGTSGAVNPAAGFVQIAKHCGAHTIEINPQPTQNAAHFDEQIMGNAGSEVPRWVAQMIAELS